MLTADGEEVIFASFASTLDANDRDDVSDLYVKHLSTGRLSLVSTNGAGEKGGRRSTAPAISADGRVVAFTSEATNLGPQPADPPQLDAYTKDMASGEVTLAAVAADDSRANALSVSPALSRDGSRVAFATPATNLSPSDTNLWADAYLVGAEAPKACPVPGPKSTLPPSIAGTARQGEVLTAQHATWTNSPTSYTHEWQACDRSGENCTPIAGATSQTYTITAGNVGHTIRVQETAANAGGSASAVSASTAVVVPLANSSPVEPGPAVPSSPPAAAAAPAARSTAEIRAQLLRDIVPHGRAPRSVRCCARAASRIAAWH